MRAQQSHLVLAFKGIQCDGQEECEEDELAHDDPGQPVQAAEVVGGTDHRVHGNLEVFQVENLQASCAITTGTGFVTTRCCTVGQGTVLEPGLGQCSLLTLVCGQYSGDNFAPKPRFSALPL